VNSICGGMENYSRQTWTDHATFFVGAAGHLTPPLYCNRSRF
jgi:hypothetical protein